MCGVHDLLIRACQSLANGAPDGLRWRVSAPLPHRIGENTTLPARSKEELEPQLLHLVFGGELESVEDVRFRNISELDIVGIYPNYAKAYDAWKSAAQRTVDNAHMRYFVVHLHRFLEPDGANAGAVSATTAGADHGPASPPAKKRRGKASS
ncbi:MAG: DUF4170 domain-containing protein [Rhizobiales bacterium]|nr:DUF4170 domain-containing protein [Hyphomicrobiales bacterium]